MGTIYLCARPVRFVLHALPLLVAFGLANSVAVAETRRDPRTWILWRCGPIPFPNEMKPSVPELSREAAIDFGRFGEELRIVLPTTDALPSVDDAAVRRMAELIAEKAPRAKIIAAPKLSDEDCKATLLLLGTVDSNPWIRKVLGDRSAALLADVRPKGYAITHVDGPFAPGQQCIVACGADGAGAWAAAEILAYSIHPDKKELGTLRNWPVELPLGTYWLPFTARYTLDADRYEIRARTEPDPPRPRIPFGVRIWGSPMPTLESYQRVIRALARTGMNTVVVQSGGWVDVANAPALFTKALDIAWQEGLYTILYVGNEELAHLPAPLSDAHRAVVLATKDHPGLLGWHLYNQLAAKLSEEQRNMVREQLAWLRSVSDKPIGNEVVWGHNLIAIPEDKQQLMSDLQRWGNDTIATDYAPIGGWTREPVLANWELRLRELEKLGIKSEAVLQAHVPFLEPTVPSREALRNQYWWALAGGAKGFFIETAYLFTHFSVRGLLSWTGEPLTDGRYDEVCELAAITRKLEAAIADSDPLDESEASETGIALVRSRHDVALRMRRNAAGTVYAILINGALEAEATVRITAAGSKAVYRVADLMTGSDRGRLDADRRMIVKLPAGGGAVFRLETTGRPK
ncbi:MAG TPA: hypothetical protein VG713_20835 [Pirellulales bacterium]|nr:hypothetical protein [Pirellulales bacterium]